MMEVKSKTCMKGLLVHGQTLNWIEAYSVPHLQDITWKVLENLYLSWNKRILASIIIEASAIELTGTVPELIGHSTCRLSQREVTSSSFELLKLLSSEEESQVLATQKYCWLSDSYLQTTVSRKGKEDQRKSKKKNLHPRVGWRQKGKKNFQQLLQRKRSPTGVLKIVFESKKQRKR